MDKKIAILLSTYNGEKFVEELIESIHKQSYTNYHLFIRDDGSTDSTCNILSKAYNLDTTTILESNNNIGVKKSFSELLEYALNCDHYEYFMFADQDDIWLQDKILNGYSVIKQKDPLVPFLVHTDMIVTNEELGIINKSFWSYQYLKPDQSTLNRILMQNVVTGCTVMFNRALAIKSYPIPEEAIMHDWWLAIVASTFGEIEYLSEPEIYYRQHQKNTLGAQKFSIKYILEKLFKNIEFEKNIIQANKFVDNYKALMNSKDIEMLKAFCSLETMNYFNRLKIIIKYRFYKIGFVRNLALFIKLYGKLKEDNKSVV